MYTYCPHCSAVFSVNAAHLSKAGGLARCGECRQIYSVIDYLYEDLLTARMALAEAEAAAGSKETGAVPGAGTVTAPVVDGAGVPASSVEAQMDDDRDAPEADELLLRPLYTGSREQSSRPMRHIVSAAGIVVLSLALAMQWVYFNRARLATHAGWRPALEQYCELLRCELPLRADLARLSMIQRDVRKHPAVENALLINAAFENRADFVQPYPILEVSFTNPSGVPVAMRRFHPDEYLAKGTDLAAGIRPNMTLQVVLEVQDPGEAATSYQFGFL